MLLGCCLNSHDGFFYYIFSLRFRHAGSVATVSSLVSTTPDIKIKLLIPTWIFVKKIRNGPEGILKGPGETD
jgi:hypothetical protein